MTIDYIKIFKEFDKKTKNKRDELSEIYKRIVRSESFNVINMRRAELIRKLHDDKTIFSSEEQLELDFLQKKIRELTSNAHQKYDSIEIEILHTLICRGMK
jgi:tyrosyl-tRNA synthetase